MNCTSKDCRDAPALFNDTHSLNSDTPLEIEDVQNEYLGDGNFTGLLGLACESTVGRRERVSSSGFTQRGAASSAGACLKLPSVAGVPLSLRDQVK
jgi:hypothetical protein